MINVNQLTSELRMMPDQALQRMAMMYKNDPYIFPMVISEDMARKKLRQAAQADMYQPQPKVADQAIMSMGQQPQPMPAPGIAALQAPNMQGMADGGIAGYDDMATYADGGDVMMAPGSTSSYQRTSMSPGMLDFAQRSEPVVRMAGGGVPRYQAGGRSRNVLQQYEELIRTEAERNGVDPDLALRLFMTESGGDPEAVSPKGAVGLGQLMPAAAKEMGLSPEDRRDPVKNIRASIQYFAKQQQKYNDPALAAAAYNWGPGNVDAHLKKNKGVLSPVGLPKETADYLTKLLPMSSAQAAKPVEATPPIGPVNAQIPGQTVQAPAAVPEGFFSRLGSDLGLSEETKRNLGNILMAPTPMAVLTAPAKVPGQLTGLRKLHENVSRFFASPSAARKLTPEEIAAMQRATQSEAQAAQAAQSATRVAQESGATVDEAAYLADLARRTEAAKAAKAAADRVPSAAEHLQLLQQAERAQNAARATQVVSPSVAAAQTAKNVAAGAAMATSGGAQTPKSSTPAYDRAVGQGAWLGEEYPTKEEKKTALDTAKTAIPKKERKGLTNDDLVEIGLRMMANPGTAGVPVLSSLTKSFGEAGLGALAARREREKAEREEAKELSESEYRAALTRKAEAEAGVYESGTRGAQAAVADARQRLADWDKSQGPMAQVNPNHAAIRDQVYRQYLQESFKALGLTLPPELSSQTTGAAAKRLVFNPQTGKIE